MEDIFKNYEKTITKKHSVNFTPKYKEEFGTSVNNTLFVAIAEKAVERLGWDLVFKDESNIEAKRSGKILGVRQWTEVITVSYENGNVVVKSESLGNEMWDLGRNSKRVKLFIYAFEETLKTFDRKSLNELEKEIKKKNNWDDYVIPESLPQAIQAKTPNIAIPIIGGLIISLILGFVIALISVKVTGSIFPIVLLTLIAITFSMQYLIKFSNYTNFNILKYVLAAMVFLIYLSSQYFEYAIILHENNYDSIGVWAFLKLRFSKGLAISNTDWIFLAIGLLLQFGLVGLFLYLRFVSFLTKYAIERVPIEVVDFAYYHFLKEKTEEEVRNELAQKGWTDKINQDEVFEAIAGFQNSIELNRVK